MTFCGRTRACARAKDSAREQIRFIHACVGGIVFYFETELKHTRGDKGSSLGFLQSRYLYDSVNGSQKWRQRDARDVTSLAIELPASTGTARLAVTSHLSTCLCASGKGAHHFLRYCFFIRGRPPTWPDTLVVRRACVQSCKHGHGYDPITGSECCASIIRSKIPTLIRPTMHVCGVNVPTGRSSDRFGRDTVIMRTSVSI